jgi:hypothetical protein
MTLGAAPAYLGWGVVLHVDYPAQYPDPGETLSQTVQQFGTAMNRRHMLPTNHANIPLHCDHVRPLF